MSVNRLRNSDRGRTVGRRWFAIALAVFLVVDVALVVWAVSGRGAVEGDASGPPVTVAVSESPRTTPTPEPTPTQSSTPVADAVPPKRVITAVSDEVAWRAQVGSCPDGTAVIERSEDGGATWQSSEVRNTTDARSVLRIVARSSDEAYAVTLNGGDCQAGVAGTYVAGAEWASYPERLPGFWYVNPADRATVVTSNGAAEGPCENVVALAPRNASDGAVLCANHSVFMTNDAGGSWSDAVAVTGAADVAVASAGYYVAVAGHESCQGTSIVKITDGEPEKPRGCVGTEAAAGDIAISAVDDAVWVWSGDLVQHSNDGGDSWQ